MKKLRIKKQKGKEIEFIKDVEFDTVPMEGQDIEVDDKLYTVKSIIQSEYHYSIIVKDKLDSGVTGTQYL
jgi:hypothetical protein